MTKPPKILFLTLRTFSLTGGVEKVCRGIGYALQQMHKNGEISFEMLSFYDSKTDSKYVSNANFIGLGGSKRRSTIASIMAGINSDIVILSHINLSPVGLTIKLLSPKTKVIMWAHGIEIWRELNWLKKKFLKVADKVVAVSKYTAGTLTEMHGVNAGKIEVIPNGLDPYFEVPDLNAVADLEVAVAGSTQTPSTPRPYRHGQAIGMTELRVAVPGIKYQDKIEELQKRYNLKPGKKIFIAVTRLKATEQHKNYDKVIRILGLLKKEGKEAYYMLCGRYDDAEYKRIREIACEAGMENNVVLTGFLPEDEITAHYLLADAFVLPSTKEGFGIVFAEAQACGLYVLAGNKDGSPEAVANKMSGTLVDPSDDKELKRTLENLISSENLSDRATIQKQAIQYFSFNVFRNNIHQLISKYAN